MLQKLKQVSWLPIIYSLLAVAVISLILASHFLTPPAELTPATFWPFVFFGKLIIPLVLFLPFGFLLTIGIYLSRKKWMEAFASFLFLILVTYFAVFGAFFSQNFEIVDSIQKQEETDYLGWVSDLDGGNYLAFCSIHEGKGTCDYFFTEYWDNGHLEMKQEPGTKNTIVSLKEITIYRYAGRFPGECVVAPETLYSANIVGKCGSNFHGGTSDQ